MAVYFKGMTTEEISHMTMKMVQTGQQFDLSAIPGIKVDKTFDWWCGRQKVTLVLCLWLQVSSAVCPKWAVVAWDTQVGPR